MKYIANILTDKTFSDNELYNVVSSKESLVEGIPTLVVGWEFTKLNYPKVSIIDWKVEDGIYWTFGNRERRAVFEARTKKFKEMAINHFIKSVKYVNVSMLTSTNDEKLDFMNRLACSDGIRIYCQWGMAYIYNPCEEVVYGVSLRELDYMGKNGKAFLGEIYGIENAEGVNADSLSPSMKFAFRNCNYIIPYLMS